MFLVILSGKEFTVDNTVSGSLGVLFRELPVQSIHQYLKHNYTYCLCSVTSLYWPQAAAADTFTIKNLHHSRTL